MKIDKLTPILVVDAIEPALPFWTEAMGFKEKARVPHEDKIGFVLLTRGALEVMLQTRASVAADLPAMKDVACALYADVPSVEKAVAALGPHATIIAGPRDTFYGAREVWVRDGAGNVVGLAETK
jgi:uncharacterized glyoxalase superfamily protein PhnB